MFLKSGNIKNSEDIVNHILVKENVIKNTDPLATVGTSLEVDLISENGNKTFKSTNLLNAELFKVKNGKVVKVENHRKKRLKPLKSKSTKKETSKKLTSLERLIAQIDAQLIARGEPVPKDVPNPISDLKSNKIHNNLNSKCSNKVKLPLEDDCDSDFSWPLEKNSINSKKVLTNVSEKENALTTEVPNDNIHKLNLQFIRNETENDSKKLLINKCSSFKLFDTYEHFLKCYQYYLKVKLPNLKHCTSYYYDGAKLKLNSTNNSTEEFIYITKPSEKYTSCMFKNNGLKHNMKFSTHKCNVCNVDYTHLIDLLRHVYEVHKIIILTKNSFVSDLNANEIANDRVTVTVRNGERLDLYKCNKCAKMFVVRKSLADHKRRVHLKSNSNDTKYSFRCQTCNTAYTRSNDYMRHVKLYHKIEEKYVPRGKLGHGLPDDALKRQILQDSFDGMLYFKDGMFSCDFCRRKSSTIRSFREHLKKDHRSVNADGCFPYSCQRCRKVFVTECQLTKHARHVHHFNIKPSCLEADKRFFCDMCTKRFVFKQSLRRHIESTHLKEFNSRCEFICEDGCTKMFSTKLLLENHIKLYNNFRCQICNKHFYSRSMLDKHQIIHTNSRQFICSICAKAYMHRHHLMQHELTHGDRTHLCPHCPTAFFTGSQLNSHLKIHSSDKPFECKFCSKSFKRRQTLCDHEKLHTGEKSSFTCSLCKKKFRTDNAFRKHTRIHKR